MKTLSLSESTEWCGSRCVQVSLGAAPQYLDAAIGTARFKCPSEASRQYWFCGMLDYALGNWESCLLLVVEWGVWPSSENWHLYNRLRRSYGDDGALEKAPGHLFMEQEKSDLRSILQVCVGMGWSVVLVPQNGDRMVFVSHDEWVELASTDEDELKRFATEFVGGGLERL